MAKGLIELPWRRRSGWLAIFWGGLIAGTLDILSAFLMLTKPQFGPMRLLQGIASGLLGRSSFSGGWKTAALGLVCHFAIAFGAAGVYYAVSRKLRVLVQRPVICGLLYGIPVYLVTNFVVIPLSRIGMRPMGPLSGMALSLGILMVIVGLPIALMTRRFAG